MRPSDEQMYRLLLERDPAADGLFFVGVRTTGIFCRPTCAARKPHRRNVEFFVNPRDALHAGYRPCRRCHPMDQHRRPPEWVNALRTAADAAPHARLTERDLRRMSIDPGAARAYFRRNFGMTFTAYHRARRLGLALADLRRGCDPGTVALRHGFASESGFREAFSRLFGRPPGSAVDVRSLTARWIDTPLGAMIGVAHDDGLCLLEFVDRRALERELEELCRHFRGAIVPGSSPHLDHVEHELREYFEGRRSVFTVAVVSPGSEFQRAVWSRLRQIPCGRTESYGSLARSLGRDGAQRAVGRVNGQNRIAIVIPCHRVVNADGKVGGYGGGRWRKEWLLQHERSMSLPRTHAARRTARAEPALV